MPQGSGSSAKVLSNPEFKAPMPIAKVILIRLIDDIGGSDDAGKELLG